MRPLTSSRARQMRQPSILPPSPNCASQPPSIRAGYRAQGPLRQQRRASPVNEPDPFSVESFFSTLKLELALGNAFHSREAARLAVFHYIEAFYNRARMHSALGYQSPAQYEERLNRLGYVP